MSITRLIVSLTLLLSACSLASALEQDFQLPGDGTIQLVYIPAGPFEMGNNGHEPYSYPDELPRHSVDLSAFSIGKYEVTRGQYRRFIDAGGYSNPAYWSKEGWAWKNTRKQPGMWDEHAVWGPPMEFDQTDDYPVAGVSYYEAEAFCNWAGLQLPTEAQWEKAARWDGKNALTFPWGNKWDPAKCNNWYDELYVGYQSAPVGSYPSGESPYGCQDMAGNLWEWCKDWYDPDYYLHTPNGGWVDPQGPQTGKFRVMRGGSWYYFDYNTRCAARGNYFFPGNWYYEYGFRVALPESVRIAFSTQSPPKSKARISAKLPLSRKGAAAYIGKDAIGGGNGYSRMINRSQAKYVASNIVELKSVLALAKAGEIIYIADNAKIDASAERKSFIVPGGVTIAGNRGRNGSPGPVIFTNWQDCYPLFITGGPGIRFTGLRVQGPDTEIRATGDDIIRNAVGIVVNHPDFEQDNCEVLGWTAAATTFDSAGPGGRVHHCYIHNNRRAGNGYGVYVHMSYVAIEANKFDNNRHDVAGSGRAKSSYRACYNISNASEPFTSHAFDMHGNHNSRGPNEVVEHTAGDSIVIAHNTFKSCRPRIYIAIRGKPRQGVIIHDNVFENAFIAADVLEPCSNAVIYDNEFTVPAKRSYFQFATDGNLVNGKRVKAGELRKLPK
ncbi:MAG: formylglycine-generating enzyme family protein [Armatimonadota bacterium]|nr:formylglycine-generating enzyme family protein [Armatimonadota bacterium]